MATKFRKDDRVSIPQDEEIWLQIFEECNLSQIAFRYTSLTNGVIHEVMDDNRYLVSFSCTTVPHTNPPYTDFPVHERFLTLVESSYKPLTQEKAQAVVDKVRAILKHYKVSLIGTCTDEGIFGEITIIDNEDPDMETGFFVQGWRMPLNQVSNKVEVAYHGDEEDPDRISGFTVDGIG